MTSASVQRTRPLVRRVAVKRLLMSVLLAPLVVLAASDHAHLDRAPIDPRDAVSIQRGAQVFANYCQNCHGAQYMRYNRLTEIGLTEQQIADNLLFASDKVGATMGVALRATDAKGWFGVPPPDLSVLARSRGADWLYTYLRSYYRDQTTATGWNNVVFPNVGMPHVLWELQGQQTLKIAEEDGPHGKHKVQTLVLETPGSISPREYDQLVADLVNYLVYMGEPARARRMQIGLVVLMGLGALFAIVYLLKKEYWKDVH